MKNILQRCELPSQKMADIRRSWFTVLKKMLIAIAKTRRKTLGTRAWGVYLIPCLDASHRRHDFYPENHVQKTSNDLKQHC